MPYDCVLKPGEVARIPLGFGLIIPDGFAGYVFPRSSMAAKGLVCELPPIGEGFADGLAPGPDTGQLLQVELENFGGIES